MTVKYLPVLLENRLVWGVGVPRGSRAEAQGSSSQAWKINVVFMSQVGL